MVKAVNVLCDRSVSFLFSSYTALSVASSVFSVAKKLSETALSQQSPLRLMLATMPSASRASRKSSLAY